MDTGKKNDAKNIREAAEDPRRKVYVYAVL